MLFRFNSSHKSSGSSGAAPAPDTASKTFSSVPHIDLAGNKLVALAPLPIPLNAMDVDTPAPPATPMATPATAAAHSKMDVEQMTPMRFPSLPPVAPTPQDSDTSRSKALASVAKKREAPVALQSPAKRRRLSLSTSKAGTIKSVVLSSPGKAAHLFSANPASISPRGLGDEALPESISPREKIITHTRNYSCDKEVSEKAQKKAQKSAEQRERSATIVPMDVDYPPASAASRPRSGSASSTGSISPRLVGSEEGDSSANKFSQGSMKEIIEWMILGNDSASNADAFIMAYSHFKQSSADLFGAIFDLYQRSSNDINQKRRIVSFLSRWLDNQYSTDFLANGAAVGTVSTAQYARLREMMNQDGFDVSSSADGSSTTASAAAQAGAVSKGSISRRRNSSFGGSGRMSILRRGTISASATNKFDFMNMNHQELANQITAIEFNMLRAIGMNEFKNQAWNKADKETKAPNVAALIAHFNKISFWVATEIVTTDLPKEQVKRISKFIKFASYLKEAGNLNGVMEIISGLNSLPVQRLRSSWKAVPSKHVSTLKKLEDLMCPTQNFLKYRQELKSGSSTMGFMNPYIGVHLGDLVHISEGYLDPEDGKYELAKIVKLGEVLIEIRKFQTQLPNALVPGEDMTYTLWLHNLKPLAPEILEKLSLEHKEREMEAAKAN